MSICMYVCIYVYTCIHTYEYTYLVGAIYIYTFILEVLGAINHVLFREIHTHSISALNFDLRHDGLSLLVRVKSHWSPMEWPTVTGSQARKQKTMMEGVRHFSDVHLTSPPTSCASISPCTDGRHRNPECFLGLQTSWPWAMAIEIQLTGEIALANTMATKIYWLLEFPMANFILPCPKMGWFQSDWWATEDDWTVGMGKFSCWKVVTVRKLRKFLQASSQFDVHSSFIQQFIHPTNLTEH